ncbi:hypothetical protein F4777DRAFT_8803 [Nemania sp. FL0916]|nr:hypothetical protein F4777DRAFT_8803 [Nemania sp. FL0916]
MATKIDDKALLMRALMTVDAETLRGTLYDMCLDSEECRKKAMKLLFVSQEHETIDLTDQSDDDNQGRSKKRRRVEVTLKLKYEVCETCKETYDITDNKEEDKDCQTHEGELRLHARPVNVDTHAAVFLGMLSIDPE